MEVGALQLPSSGGFMWDGRRWVPRTTTPPLRTQRPTGTSGATAQNEMVSFKKVVPKLQS